MIASAHEVDPERLLADLAEHLHCRTCGTPVALAEDRKGYRELGTNDGHLCIQHVVADHACDDCQGWIGVLRNGAKVNMPDGSLHVCEWAPVGVTR